MRFYAKLSENNNLKTATAMERHGAMAKPQTQREGETHQKVKLLASLSERRAQHQALHHERQIAFLHRLSQMQPQARTHFFSLYARLAAAKHVCHNILKQRYRCAEDLNAYRLAVEITQLIRAMEVFRACGNTKEFEKAHLLLDDMNIAVLAFTHQVCLPYASALYETSRPARYRHKPFTLKQWKHRP
jgi:hypothetical protein